MNGSSYSLDILFSTAGENHENQIKPFLADRNDRRFHLRISIRGKNTSRQSGATMVYGGRRFKWHCHSKKRRTTLRYSSAVSLCESILTRALFPPQTFQESPIRSHPATLRCGSTTGTKPKASFAALGRLPRLGLRKLCHFLWNRTRPVDWPRGGR